MNKKAAIELSVTAIVILILAIVILGLGLGFIRGMFGKAATQFEEQIEIEPEPPTASMADPFSLSRETLVTHAGDTEVLKIMAYNAWSGTSDSNPGVLKCTNIAGTCRPVAYYSACNAIPGCTPGGLVNCGAGTYTFTCTGADQQCTAITTASLGTLTCTDVGCKAPLPSAPTVCAGGSTATGDNVIPDIECNEDDGVLDDSYTIQSNAKEISSGGRETFNLVFKLGDAKEGVYLCKTTLNSADDDGQIIPDTVIYEKDITIKIRR